MWQNYITALLGLWVIISPFLGFSLSNLNTNLVISGVLIIIFGLWGAMTEPGDERTRSRA